MFPLRDDNPKHGPVFVLWLILLLNVLLYLYTFFAHGSEGAILQFIYAYGFIPSSFFAEPLGQAHTLLSSMFLHGNYSALLAP